MYVNKYRYIKAVIAALSLLGLSGCATITKGTSQTVTVNTAPPGAMCTLSRDSNTIAVVNPTPGSIMVEKDKDAISVICKKEGYQDNAGTLASEFQGMTLGNIVFGGLIGVAIDAGSGAMNHYPPMVTVTMIPASFESTGKRDQFFDAMRAEFITQSDDVVARIKKHCLDANCESQLKAATAARAARIDEIESKRRLASVSGS